MTPGRRILLVDDAVAVRMTLGALLEDLGHHVVEAGSLAEARQRLAPDLDVTIVDLHLPDGLGSALFDDVRAASPAAAIVLLTGAARSPIAGADLVLEKGGHPDDVERQLESAIAARRASRP